MTPTGLERLEESSGETRISARGGVESGAVGAETDAIVAPADVGGTDPLTSLAAVIADLHPADRQRLAAMLMSDHDGERDNAAREPD